MRTVTETLNKLLEFLYALFFTRDDDLDMLQILFTAIIIITLMIVWHVSVMDANNDAVKIEGLITLRWLTGLLVVTAVPKWLVPLMVTHTQTLPEKKITDHPEETT